MGGFILIPISTESVAMSTYRSQFCEWMDASSEAAYCQPLNSQSLDATLDAKLKVQLHYLPEVWLGAGD